MGHKRIDATVRVIYYTTSDNKPVMRDDIVDITTMMGGMNEPDTVAKVTKGWRGSPSSLTVKDIREIPN